MIGTAAAVVFKGFAGRIHHMHAKNIASFILFLAKRKVFRIIIIIQITSRFHMIIKKEIGKIIHHNNNVHSSFGVTCGYTCLLLYQLGHSDRRNEELVRDSAM